MTALIRTPPRILRSAVILSNSQIRKLLLNKAIVAKFPVLQSFKITKTVARSCCGGSKPAKKSVVPAMEVYDAVRVAIINFPPEQKKQLKDMLGAGQLTIPYRDARGRSQGETV